MANKYKHFAKQAQEANRRLKMCERKKAFSTQAEATIRGQQTYLCPYCNLWHRTAAFSKLLHKVRKQKQVVKVTPKKTGRKGYRMILVDGIVWEYKLGKSAIVAYSDYLGKRITDYATLTGLSNHEVERGMWKGWLHITPSQVEKWLRTND